MERRLFSLIFVMLFAIILVSAETSFFVQKDTDYNLTFTCENTEQSLSVCSGSTNCNITIVYPNSTFVVDNQATTNLNNGRFYYQLNENQTNLNGEYQVWVGCTDGDLNDSTSFTYEVNPTGIRPSDQKTETTTRSIYFVFIIGILFFLGFLFVNQKPPVKWTMFIFAVFFWLITLNLLFVSMQDEVVNPRLETFFDSFTAISFYVYWFLAGILILLWVLTFFQTYFFKKNLRNLQRFGGEIG